MDVPNIARPKACTCLSIWWREIFEQFDLVAAGRFYDRELKLSAFHSGDLLRHFTFLMRRVRKFETKNIAPKGERAFEIRNRDSGMIGRDDSKGHQTGLARF